MMNSKDLRVKAWGSLKGKYWLAFGATLVIGILNSLGSGLITGAQLLLKANQVVDPAQMNEAMLSHTLAMMGIVLVLCLFGVLISIFVGSTATVGSCNYFIKNTDSKPSFADIFSGFKTNYGRNIKTIFAMSVKIALWSLLLIVPGVIKSFEYAMVPYILADDGQISSKDAFQKSKQMMMGNKWRLFKLNFAFIGWILLCIPTIGIGAFFLIPYVDAANAEFYMELKNN